MCEDDLWALPGDSAAMEGGIVPLAVFEGALKGNSPGSLVYKGSPVGADRMILGAPLEVDDVCNSSVSFALSPTRSGERSRRGSFPSAAVCVVARGLRPIGDTSDSGVSAMFGGWNEDSRW